MLQVRFSANLKVSQHQSIRPVFKYSVHIYSNKCCALSWLWQLQLQCWLFRVCIKRKHCEMIQKHDLCIQDRPSASLGKQTIVRPTAHVNVRARLLVSRWLWLLCVYRGQFGAFARQFGLQFVERLLQILAHDNIGRLGNCSRTLGSLLLEALNLALRFGAALRVPFGGGGGFGGGGRVACSRGRGGSGGSRGGRGRRRREGGRWWRGRWRCRGSCSAAMRRNIERRKM